MKAGRLLRTALRAVSSIGPASDLPSGLRANEPPVGSGVAAEIPAAAKTPRVAGAEVARRVDDHHGPVGRDLSRAPRSWACGSPHLPRAGSRSRRSSPGGRPLRLLLHPGDRSAMSRAAEQIGVDEVLPEIDEVAVGVDEPGKERLAGEIDRPSSWGRTAPAPRRGSPRTVILPSCTARPRPARARAAHREDVAARVDHCCGGRRGLRPDRLSLLDRLRDADRLDRRPAAP